MVAANVLQDSCGHCNNFKKPVSSRIWTPNSLALSSLEPASSPAMTAVVFLDTDDDTSAPRALSFSFASSRDIDSSEPVRTNVLPASLPMDDFEYEEFAVGRAGLGLG